MRLSLWGWGPILPQVRGAKVKAPRPSAGWRHQLGSFLSKGAILTWADGGG